MAYQPLVIRSNLKSTVLDDTAINKTMCDLDPISAITVAQCSDWIVINKPAGLSLHSEGNEPGLVEQIKQRLSLNYLAPVHRLDKVTSGCLLLAKHPESASWLSKQFQNRLVEKYYLALTAGKPKKKQGSIIGDMVPARNGNYKLTQSKNNPAITQFFSYGLSEGIRLVIVRLLTGKTHQIRVALKSISSPILGDERYGSSQSNISIDRCYLHAYQLTFDDLAGNRKTVSCLPLTGERFTQSIFKQAIKDVSVDQLAWPKTRN